MSGGTNWSDLRPRVLSGIALAGVGALAVWLGGVTFAALVILVIGAMQWELARMTGGAGALHPMILGGAGALALLMILLVPSVWILLLIFLPAVMGIGNARRDRAVFAAYAVLIMLTGYGLISLRNVMGLSALVWVISVVVVSDVAGYFAGRTLGGPKFWPKISPKKTWSGTVAGWIGAALVGAGFYLAGWGGAALIWISPLVAFAGQLGDIAESAIKRRAGVKDSSRLIPGHGGFMDRFDALATAVVLVVVLAHLTVLPFGGN